MRYYISEITDLEGNDKAEAMQELRKHHGNLVGEFLWYDYMKENLDKGENVVCCFAWDDKSSKMLRTSLVNDIKEDDGVITITTLNSIYTFREALL